MKQGKGTDVLGADDPRSETIGVIYVSPNDDRKSVLAAILTQEKLGRKQVAVMLPPNQNKAFQRPGDFDDLKTMRRKMQTQVVFIAPSGPGPAEFARQRRFLVYSSLESYAKALNDDVQVESATKKSWLFGSPRTKADSASTPSNGSTQRIPTGTALPATQELDTPANGRSSPFEDDEHERNGSLLPFAAGAALGGGAAIAANSAHNARAQGGNQAATPPYDFADNEDDLGPPPASPARTSVPADLYGPTQAIPPSHPADATTNGGSIIELRSRSTGKATLPLTPREPDPVPVTPVVVPEADSTTNLPRPKRSTGKMAAAVGVGAVGAAAAVAANPARASASSGRASAAAGAGAVAPRPGGPSGIPPRSTPPGRGGGGGGRGPRSRGGWVILGLVVLVIALLACGGLMAYAQPKSLPGQIAHSLVSSQQSPASITITPSSQTIQDTYTLVGANATNPASRQVAVHTITGAAQSAAIPVKATGHSQHAATAATGWITFHNALSFTQQVNGGTTFNLGGGLRIITNAAVDIPPLVGTTVGSMSVSAHADPPGVAGNIGALTISNLACCGSGGIVANNFNAFTGGQDAVNYAFLQQSDVNNAISQSIQNVTRQDALNDLKRQLVTGEVLLNSTHCTPTLRADQPIGDQGTNVNSANVSYLMKCTSTAYDNLGAQNIVKSLLTEKANSTLAPGYVLINSIQASLTNQTETKNVLSLFFNGKGVWAYQFTDAQKLQLAKAIAGKTVAQAQSILKSTPGIGNVTINVNGGNTLPTDYNQISIVIQPIAGLGGGATPPPSGSPTVTNPTVQSGTPGSNGKGGSLPPGGS